MKGEVVEIVCSNIRQSFAFLKTHVLVKEVQAFGDRVNVVVQSASNDIQTVLSHLKDQSIEIFDWRVVKPSLENVFISLLTENK